MSEVDARPSAPRGRSSHRGGRGGFGRGGPRGGRKPANGTAHDAVETEESYEDQGELGEMKKKYAPEMLMLKDMFPDWTNDDLVFALQEADGDVAGVVDRITQGNVSQFAEVKSAKDRARSKAKEPSAQAGASADKSAVRGSRGRGGFDSTRGTRARGTDRGRGGYRGGRGGQATTTNDTWNHAEATSIPTTEASAWADTTATASTWVDTTATAAEGSWDDTAKDAGDNGPNGWDIGNSTAAVEPEPVKSSLIPEGGAKMTWASMLAPKPAPVPVKKAPIPQPAPAPAPATAAVDSAPLTTADVETALDPEPESIAPPIEEHTAENSDIPEVVREPVSHEAPGSGEGDQLAITPSRDALTEENVEHLPDDTSPPATQTVASTTGSLDPRNLTPLPGQQAPIGRPPVGGFATTAYRATGQPGRSASFQRRVQEQQEAVVMPGHNAVDRAAVQFGSMGLNGEPGSDVDEDREEPETRQAPQHSPPSQPRTSLPPAPRQMPTVQDQGMPEALPTPKQAPGLPPASQQNQQMQDASLASGFPNEPSQMSQNYNQYGRYGQSSMQPEAIAPQQQKPYDPFSHQAQSSQYDQYGAQGQQAPQQQPQQPSQSGFGGLSSAPDNYSNYYTSEQQRNAYSQYYGGSGYGPQDVRSQLGQTQQDAGIGQQRSASGFGAGPQASGYPSQAEMQVSIPFSLQTLSATLYNSSDEDERQGIIEEMQHIISGSAANKAATRVNNTVPLKNLNVPRNNGREILSDRHTQRPTQKAPLSDATNRQTITSTSSAAKSKALAANSQAKTNTQSRFAEPTNSGHNTPHPHMGGAAQQQQQPPASSTQQSQHSMHQAPTGQQQQQQGGYGGSSHYPYGHPSYSSPYGMAYQNQFTGYNQQYPGYGGGYPSKQQSGMYTSSHGYGMGPQSSYDQHSASPANTGAYSQNQQASMRNVSGMSSGLGGLDEYGRGSAQSGGGHQQSTAGFGNTSNDPFARSASGFGGQHTGYGQQSMAAQEDSLKPFVDSSKNGPSPALGQPGRPGSAANSAAGSAQAGLPHQAQSQQSGFGGYGSFPAQSQYGGLGGLGSQQQQPQQQQQQQHGQSGAQGGYGSYGAGGFGNTYGSYNSRGGGWGAQYGAH